MRIRFLIASTSLSFFVFGAAVQACSGKSEDTAAIDAGGDALEAGRDTSVADAEDAAPPCDPKKDFLKDIPDASIADGGSSVGICLGCASKKCDVEIKKCAADCVCQGLAGKALECYAKTNNIIGCVGQFASASVPSATRTVGIGLGSCVQSKCSDECAAAEFNDAGADADAN